MQLHHNIEFTGACTDWTSCVGINRPTRPFFNHLEVRWPVNSVKARPKRRLVESYWRSEGAVRNGFGRKRAQMHSNLITLRKGEW
jgi:hypothetical protein